MYRFYVNDTSIGNSTNGMLSMNANDCFKFNGYFKCLPENSKGQGEIKQQLLAVIGMLSIFDDFYVIFNLKEIKILQAEIFSLSCPM